jgi:hypothetical protein
MVEVRRWIMSRIRWAATVLALCIPMGLLLGACGEDVVETTGTNTLTVEVTNLVGAQGSELTAELSKNVDYMQKAPVWTFLVTSVTSSPFSYSDTVPQLPEGEFDLSVTAGSDKDAEATKAKGQSCEMSFTMGRDESVTITIDGLNPFGDKGYGPCAATVTQK